MARSTSGASPSSAKLGGAWSAPSSTTAAASAGALEVSVIYVLSVSESPSLQSLASSGRGSAASGRCGGSAQQREQRFVRALPLRLGEEVPGALHDVEGASGD